MDKNDKQRFTKEKIKHIFGWTVVIVGVLVAAYFISQAKPRSRLVCSSSRNVSLTSFGACRAVND